MDLREFGVVMEGVLCTECGVPFAVAKDFFDARVADQRPFRCPNAHQVELGVESSSDRLLSATARRAAALERLVVARLEECARLERELANARRALVDAAVGPATAEERS